MMIFNLFKKVKTFKLWAFFVYIFFMPIYGLVWKNIINLQGRFLYLSWFLNKKRNFFDLKNNDKIIIDDDIDLKMLASKISEECTDSLLDNSKKLIMSSNINKKNYSETGENNYKNSIMHMFSEKLKDEIFEFATSEKMISTAARYLGVFPVLAKMTVYHNIPRPGSSIRGAMNWHKDDFGYKSLDLFLNITDIDENSGPLYALKKREKLGVFSRSFNEIKNAKSGEQGKISIDKFENNLKTDDIITLKGSKGKGLFIDSFTAYHRGGYCKTKDRVMLRFSYQTPDSVRLTTQDDNCFYYYKKINKKNVRDKYIHYLLFKRSNLDKKIGVNQFFLKIYRLLSYRFSIIFN